MTKKLTQQAAIAAIMVAVSFGAAQFAEATGPGLWWGFFSIATGIIGVATTIVTLVGWGERP